MPTYTWLAGFQADFERLTPTRQAAFLVAVQQFVEDLQAGRGFRNGLRVKGIQSASGIFEMTWASDGRATFEYGAEVTEGQPHVIWRRVETQPALGESMRAAGFVPIDEPGTRRLRKPTAPATQRRRTTTVRKERAKSI